MTKNSAVTLSLTTILAALLIFSGFLKAGQKTHKGELSNIRASIHARGAGWTATENEISIMDPDSRRTLLGHIPEAMDGMIVFWGDTLTAFPGSFDWTDHDGNNWNTWIRNQYDCGSCVAFGSLGALEARMNIFMNDWDWDPDLSEQHLFSCGGGSCWWGWTVSSSMNYLKNTGTPEEACLVYQSYNVSCSETCSDWQGHKMRIRDWVWVSNDRNSIKTYLQEGPLTTCMDVYTDFFYYDSGVYEPTWGSYEGGHCITFVGWDDESESWICKNSWGAGWGESGYFKIKYEKSGIGSSTTRMDLYPLIRVSTDRDIYYGGDEHVLGVKVVNPGSDYTARVKVWIRFPNGSDHTVYSRVLTIPAGVSFAREAFLTFLVPPQLETGEYHWYGAVLNSSGTDTKSFDMSSFDIIN